MTVELEGDLRRALASAAERAPLSTPPWPLTTTVPVAGNGPNRGRLRSALVLGGAVAASTVAVLVVALRAADRPDPAYPAADPPGVARVLQASARADRIDAYPIVDWQVDGGVYGGFGVFEQDPFFAGTVGLIGADRTPNDLIAVAAFPQGFEPLSGALPGRLAGVDEARFETGATLTWKVDDVSFSMVGKDLDLMYELLDRVQPGEHGYELVGDLPGGLVELEAPYRHSVPWTSDVATGEEAAVQFNVSVQEGPVLSSLVSGGVTEMRPVMINGLDGYEATTGRPVIGLAVSTDETLWVSSETMSRAELTELAGQIRLVDEAAYREHYGLGVAVPTGPTTVAPSSHG